MNIKEQEFTDKLYRDYPAGSGVDNIKIRRDKIIEFFTQDLDKKFANDFGVYTGSDEDGK